MFIDVNKISGISCNSNSVIPGSVFVAIRGSKFNGEDYIGHAIQNGATDIVLAKEAQIKQKNGVNYHYVENTYIALSELAALFYKYQPSNLVAVTGTNGKTSVAWFFQQICGFLGLSSACVGTLGVISSNNKSYKQFHLTTPGAIEVHETLLSLYNDDVDYVAAEVSSHALDQYRVDGVRFKAAGFTNFTQDHLDYHKNFDNYFNAKARLFKDLLNSDGVAVLNADINEYSILLKYCNQKGIKVIDYGVNAEDIKIKSFSPKWEVEIFGNHFILDVIFDADFQLYNMLCAIGLVLSCGDIDIGEIIGTLPKLKAAGGRFEKVSVYKGADIYVDYAHTPDALENVLLNAKKLKKGKLYVLFGCGGERDVEKRSKMGGVAAKLADYVIVTDDNPRNEDPASIRADVLKGCPRAEEISPRDEAIKMTIKKLKLGDVLVIAGKGHEDYQILGNKKIHFSDAEVVKDAVKITSG